APGTAPAPAPPPPSAIAGMADAEVVDETISILLARDGTAHESGSRAMLLRTEAGLSEAMFVLPVMPLTEMPLVTGSLDLPGGKVIKLEPKDILERPYLNGLQVASDVKLV